MTLTIEKGNEEFETQVTTQQALKIILPINEANHLWKLNVYVSSLFIAVFIAFVYPPLSPKKHRKWYILVYFSSLVVFIIWDIAVHRELAAEIIKVMNGLKIYLE